jgi:hypothetical protein
MKQEKKLQPRAAKIESRADLIGILTFLCLRNGAKSVTERTFVPEQAYDELVSRQAVKKIFQRWPRPKQDALCWRKNLTFRELVDTFWPGK